MKSNCRSKTKLRIGQGYDSHKLIDDSSRKFILGGIEIPYSKSLKGHSDADVLTHAIIDSILGALCEGNIGKLFPDTDEKFKNISSVILLDEVVKILEDKKYSVVNVDSTVILEQPKLNPYIDQIVSNLAKHLKIEKDQINVKAKTNEKMGFIGREEGIAVFANVLLEGN